MELLKAVLWLHGEFFGVILFQREDMILSLKYVSLKIIYVFYFLEDTSWNI